MTILVEYDKIGLKRYIRTITRNGKIMNVPLNLEIINNKTKKDLDSDFTKVKRMLRGKK